MRELYHSLRAMAQENFLPPCSAHEVSAFPAPREIFFPFDLVHERHRNDPSESQHNQKLKFVKVCRLSVGAK